VITTASSPSPPSLSLSQLGLQLDIAEFAREEKGGSRYFVIAAPRVFAEDEGKSRLQIDLVGRLAP